MEKGNVFELLIFEPEKFFSSLKNRKISLRELLISFSIVLLSSLSNIASALYLHKKVTPAFSLYIILSSLIMWFIFSLTVFFLSRVFSAYKWDSFPNLLYGIGVSRAPLVVFVLVQFIVLLGRYRINERSMQFLMIYVIVILWMFYLYATCIEKLFNVSIAKSILIIILAFVVVLAIATTINTALNISAIYF